MFGSKSHINLLKIVAILSHKVSKIYIYLFVFQIIPYLVVKFCNFILFKVIHTWLELLIYFPTYMKLLVLLLWVFIVLFILLKTSHYYCGHKSISHWFIYISIVSSYFHTITLKVRIRKLFTLLSFFVCYTQWTRNGDDIISRLFW